MQQGVRKRLVRELALVGLSGGAVLSCLSVLILGGEHVTYCPQRPFDARVWNDPAWRESDCVETNFHSVRQQM